MRLGGSNTGACTSVATACATIQYAVGQAGSGNTVNVGPGTFPEVVSITNDLTFVGNNANVPAGVSPGTRAAESVVKGFRTAGNPGTTARSVTINGFRIDPQGDSALVSATAQALVWLRGGPQTVVRNNVFNGGSFVANCEFSCTTMTDHAFTVQSGTVTFANNTLTNFRRPVNINNAAGAGVLPTNASVTGNSVKNFTGKGITLSGSTSVQMPGATVSNNVVDATGATGSPPAGVSISNGGNTVSGNTFTKLGSAVYIDICKKFNTNNNRITGNSFTGNVFGFNANVNTDGGQCVTSATEGTGGWVVGAGRINGLVLTGNNFSGNIAAAALDGSYNWGFWNSSAYPISSGPIDATCNYWGAAAPSVKVHTYPEPLGAKVDQLVYSAAPQAVWNASPWRTASGGACNGS